jgi:hypothetical protein
MKSWFNRLNPTGQEGGFMFRRILLAGIVAAALAFSQGRGAGDMGGDGMGGGGGGMGGGRGGMGGGMGDGMSGGGGPRPQRLSKIEQFYEKLKLNKDQKEEAAKILTETAPKTRDVAEQITNGRRAIATALLQKKTDEELKPMVDAYAAVCAQMTTFEAEAFGKIYAGLKPNQQKNAAQAFELLSGVFLPIPGGGRGIGRGMSRGGRN